MKIFIQGDGDPIAGISGEILSINFSPYKPISNKKKIRKILVDLGKELALIGDIHSWFEDECPNCLSILVDGKCKNKKCINKMEVVR